MARGRFISSGITKDKAVHLLSSDLCRLAFTWLITIADCEGRVTGESDLLIAELFPRRRDITPEMIESFIIEWIEAGFIIWYEDEEGEKYIQFKQFEKHQVGLRKDREIGSKIPDPADCYDARGDMPATCRKDDGSVQDNRGENRVKLKLKLMLSKVEDEVEVEVKADPAGDNDNYYSIYNSIIKLPEGRNKEWQTFCYFLETIHATSEDLRNGMLFVLNNPKYKVTGPKSFKTAVETEVTKRLGKQVSEKNEYQKYQVEE